MYVKIAEDFCSRFVQKNLSSLCFTLWVISRMWPFSWRKISDKLHTCDVNKTVELMTRNSTRLFQTKAVIFKTKTRLFQTKTIQLNTNTRLFQTKVVEPEIKTKLLRLENSLVLLLVSSSMVLVWNSLASRNNLTYLLTLLTSDCDVSVGWWLFQLLYHVFQLILFTTLAVIIMRLKLFWTPHMCLMTSLLASRQVCCICSFAAMIVSV